MNVQVYRVGNDHKLPTHWAYGEPWERREVVTQTGEDSYDVEEKIVDCRGEGAQVFQSIDTAIAATVWHPDGDYGLNDYRLFLVIDTDDRVGDGGHYYGSITSANRVRSVSLSDLHDWLKVQTSDELVAGEVQAFVADNTGRVLDWLVVHAVDQRVEWYDSIPNLYDCRK